MPGLNDAFPGLNDAFLCLGLNSNKKKINTFSAPSTAFLRHPMGKGSNLDHLKKEKCLEDGVFGGHPKYIKYSPLSGGPKGRLPEGQEQARAFETTLVTEQPHFTRLSEL